MSKLLEHTFIFQKSSIKGQHSFASCTSEKQTLWLSHIYPLLKDWSKTLTSQHGAHNFPWREEVMDWVPRLRSVSSVFLYIRWFLGIAHCFQ